jgi:LysR family transcriptional regulator for metE and metH
MYIELRHLRSMQIIADTGSLARAAEVMHVTQSALSHQIAGLEDQVGMALFTRRSRPMALSAAGQRLLRAAQRILPEITALEQEFAALHLGKTGRLHIAIQCHACFDWLFPVLEMFRHAWPEVDVDIRAGLAFDSFPALVREEVDLVISSNPEAIDGITFHPLFDYHPVFVAAATHPLAQRPHITAADFRDQTILHYPVGRDKLDVFTELLTPAKVEPAATRPVELTAVILMLVAAGRGVAVMPDWVLRDIKTHADYNTHPLGPQTITKPLNAATRTPLYGACPAPWPQRTG